MTAKFNTTNPASGEVLKEFPTASDEEISAVIDASDAAFQTWRTTDVRERSAPLARAADLMDERRWDLAEILTLEMGKLRASSRSGTKSEGARDRMRSSRLTSESDA
ncbi:aldehyde dehydrogenase family protein [Bacillus subtilis]|nr:aldehyde dehydrogenase family protein [Bacillus subtilis]